MPLRKNKLKNKYLAFFLLLLFIIVTHASHRANADEGIILEGAWNLINGKALYIEMIHYITPGSFYLVYFFWKIFNVSYQLANALGIVFVFLSCIGVYKISRLIYNEKISFIITLPYALSSAFWPIINHNTFNILFIIWAIYYLLISINSKRVKNIIFSGLFTGCAILFLQHKGFALLFIILSFLLFLYFKEKNNIWLKLNFFYLTFSLFPLIILLSWPIDLLYQNLFLVMFKNYKIYNQVPLILFYIFLLFLISLIYIFKKNKSKKILFLLYFQTIILVSSGMQNADPYHLFLIFFPGLILLPISINKIKKKHTIAKIVYFSSLSIICFSLIIASTIYLIINPLFINKIKITAQFIISNCETTTLYAGPFLPNIYFETKKNNPTPFYYLIYNNEKGGNDLTEQVEQAAEIIKNNPPDCAVVNYQMVEKTKHNINNPLDKYILNNYKEIKKIDNLRILKLKT